MIHARDGRWRARTAIAVALPAALAWLLAGCGGDTGAPAAGDGTRGGALIDGHLDPGAGTFVLKTLDDPPPGGGRPHPVELVGSDLQADPAAQTVALQVALRNAGDGPLYGPAIVWLFAFTPPEVMPLDADLVDEVAPPDSSQSPTPVRWGYSYDGLFGEDGVLEPGEASASRTWTFHVPDGGSFGFGAAAEFGLAPGLPRLGGICFHDLNGDGWPQPDEPPAPVYVSIRFPDGTVIQVNGPPGEYGVPVSEPGLYTLTYNPPYMMPMLPLTTPNPRQVVLTTGPDGEIQGFLEAHFGLGDGPPPGMPPVQFSDLSPEELQVGAWHLLDAHVTPQGDPEHDPAGGDDPPPPDFRPLVLHLLAGFAGCDADHPFALFAATEFQAAPDGAPTVLLAAADPVDQDCEAWFQRGFGFDLQPLRERFLAWHGGPGELVLLLWNPDDPDAPLPLPVFVE